jgi:hypothetical protein
MSSLSGHLVVESKEGTVGKRNAKKKEDDN